MVALQNKRVVYNILFATAAETLRTIAADPKHLGAEIGFLAVLHTWGQNLLHHPHLHCVVPGGGLSADKQRWVSCRKRFFLSVEVLSRLFRRLFLEALSSAFEKGKLTFHGSIEKLAKPHTFNRLLANVRRLEWNVYSKRPFGGPEHVLDYLGRYTHRVAISNNRLLAFENGKVTFRWKDYRRGSQQRVMTLPADEFIRRFLLHVLPRGFQRIRQFGLLANRSRAVKLALCRNLLGVEGQSAAFEQSASSNQNSVARDMSQKASITETAQPAPPDYKSLYQTLTGRSLDQCPECGTGTMRLSHYLDPLSSHLAFRRNASRRRIVSPIRPAYAIDSS